STMPHKRNPIKSEQVCGLARVVRAQIEPAFANIPLWDERDLTNSSCERILFPEAFIFTDHLLALTARILEGLSINLNQVEKNLNLLQGLNMAESVMVELAKRGVGRQKAHEIMRSSSMRAVEEGTTLAEVLAGEETVSGVLSSDEIQRLLDPHQYIGTAVEQVDRLLLKLEPLLD
ncbi:MAG TPA: adenylosuccinate lyase, partial [Methanothrix sp.]|nr:adenylosuccinate lyase [Methanothrix sp.]HPR66624.1 adenylosuccinate lyase [Methanothrix sp.]